MADDGRIVDEGAARLGGAFDTLKRGYAAERFPAYEVRRARLDALIAGIERAEAAFVEAVDADFGGRAREETLIADIGLAAGAAREQRKNLRRRMRVRRRLAPPHFLPARLSLTPQPLGVVGVAAPWNYPVQLALAPAAAAIAAGCRVLIKPSEATPRTSAAIAAMIGDAFDDDVAAVIEGGPDVGAAFARLPFDHLLFTGSTAVGRKVYEAAAANLTPATLELGGKSPVIIDKSADLARAAKSIAQGKLYSGGQTCVAPDYVLTPRGTGAALADALAAAARGLYPEIENTADYTAIAADRHFARLNDIVDEARAGGARIVEWGDRDRLSAQRKIPLTILLDAPIESRAMTEELFGPVLPIVEVEDADAAIDFVNARPRPLALYWFGEDEPALAKVMRETVAGGVTVNDVMLHVAPHELPFGGVGASGMGAYHGAAGFETFSHLKPAFRQSRFAATGLLAPPYTGLKRRAIEAIKRLV